jgi:hypothetical protein
MRRAGARRGESWTPAAGAGGAALLGASLPALAAWSVVHGIAAALPMTYVEHVSPVHGTGPT